MASPELALVIAALRAHNPMTGASIAEVRAKMDAVGATVERADDVAYEMVELGGVRGEWTRAPASDSGRAILYFHGGGYTVGSIDVHRPLVSYLARATGAPVLNVDYRMAPEHPYPAAVEDAVAVYRHVRGGGLDADRIVLAGDSAGGGLAVACALALRDAGDALPRALACISPWLDLSLEGETLASRAAADPMLVPDTLRMMAAAYLADADPREPTASPLFAELAGLPPMLIQVGDAEVLLDDSRRFATRAAAAGADVELEVWPELIHVWHTFVEMLPEARQALDGIADWLAKRGF